jgi:hypothetical protein
MKNLPDQVKNSRSLTELAIPGSHNAATYLLNTQGTNKTCYVVTLLHNLLELAILELTILELTILELAIPEWTILELAKVECSGKRLMVCWKNCLFLEQTTLVDDQGIIVTNRSSWSR